MFLCFSILNVCHGSWWDGRIIFKFMNFSNAKECKIILNKKRAKVSARWRWREIEENLYRLGRYWVGKSDVNVEFLSGFFWYFILSGKWEGIKWKSNLNKDVKVVKSLGRHLILSSSFDVIAKNVCQCTLLQWRL